MDHNIALICQFKEWNILVNFVYVKIANHQLNHLTSQAQVQFLRPLPPPPSSPWDSIRGESAPSSKPLPLTPFFDSKGTTTNNNNTNLYLSTAENHSAIQKRVNIFTPSYKLVSRQNLNRNYIIIINTPKRKLKNLFYMNAVLLVIRIVIVQKFLEHILSEILPAYSDRSFFASCAPAGGGSEAPPLKLQNRSSYGHQNYTQQWTHHFQLLGITWLTQWRCLKSLLRHSVEFTGRVQISIKVDIKYLNSKVSDNLIKQGSWRTINDL